MEDKKIRALLLGNFSEIFIKILKEVRPDFEVEKIDLNEKIVTLDYFYNFITDEFRPDIIFIHPDAYIESSEFYDGLMRKQFPKVCFHMFQRTKMNIWREISSQSLELMKNEMDFVMVELEKKEGENEKNK